MVTNQEVTVLNHLLQGTYMGIDAYNICLNEIEDKQIRLRLEEQQKVQTDMAIELASHIRDMGGMPKNGSGIMGITPQLMTRLKLMGEEKDLDILNMLSRGITMGIDSYEREMPKLSEGSKRIVEKFLAKDRDFFMEMEQMKRLN